MQNITHQATIEEALYDWISADVNLFRFLQTKALRGFWIWPIAPHTTCFFNPALIHHLGYTPSSWKELFPIEHQPSFAQFLREVTQIPPTEMTARCITLPVRHAKEVLLDCTLSVYPIQEVHGGKPTLTHLVFSCTEAQTTLLNTHLALDEEHRQLQELLKSAGIGTWSLDLHTEKITFNEARVAVIGYTLEEMQHKTVEEIERFVHPEDFARSKELLGAYIQGKTPYYDNITRVKHKEGHWVWIRDKGQITQWDENGNPVQVTGTHQDVSTQKHAELLIAKASKTNRLFIEQAPMAMAMFDHKMRYLAASKKWLKDYELEGRTIIGQSHYKLFPDIEERWKKIHATCLQGIPQKADEDVFLRKDGTPAWLSWEVRPWYIEGDTVGGLIMYTVDITEIKRKEKSEQRLKNMLRRTNAAARIGSWELDLRTNQLFWSDETYRIHEAEATYTPTLEEGIHFYKAGAPQRKLNNAITALIKDGTPLDLELELVTAKGRVIWTRSIGEVEYQHGHPIRIYGTIQDIDAQKRAEIALEETYNLLQRSNEIAKIGTWRYDLKTQDVFWSSMTQEIHGVSKSYQPSLEESTFFIANSAYKEKVQRATAEAVKTGKHFNFEIQIRTAQGLLKWVRITGSAHFEQNVCTHVYGIFQDIHNRMQNIQALAYQESRFRNLFEKAPTGMALCAKDGKLLELNPKLKDMLGYTIEELQQKSLDEIIHPSHINKYQKLFQALVDGTQTSIRMRIRFLCKEKRTCWTLLSLATIKANKQESSHFIAQVIDVTAERRTQEALKKSEQRFKGIFNSTFQFIGFLDLDGNLLEANDTALRFANVAAKEVIGRKFWKTHWWGYQDNHLKLKKAIHKAASGEFVQYEVLAWNAKKQPIPIDFSLKPIFDETGDVVSIIAEGRPIQEIVETRNALKHALQRLEGILDASTQVAVIGTNIDGVITLFNKGAENLLRYNMNEVLHQKQLIELLDAQDIQKQEQYVHTQGYINYKGFSAITARIQQGFFEDNVWRIIRKDGSSRVVQLTLTAVRDAMNEIKGYLAIAADITARKKTEAEIKSLLNVTQEQNKRLLNFAHIVSHNLRSHSSNLSMLLDLIKLELPHVTQNAYFPLLEHATTNLRDTIAHLNQVVTLNAAAHESLQALPLREYIENTTASLKGQIIDNQATVHNHVNNHIKVQAIPAYLESILLNLLSNALKYRAYTRTPKIELWTSVASNYLILHIKDNGLGINLKLHGAKLFGLYKTFHENKEARGVGLFITKNQIEAMGGRIEVESQVNQGSTFKIYFQYEPKD